MCNFAASVLDGCPLEMDTRTAAKVNMILLSVLEGIVTIPQLFIYCLMIYIQQ